MNRQNWVSVEGNNISGWKFPCGRVYNDDYFTESEVIELHRNCDNPKCMELAASDSFDEKTTKEVFCDQCEYNLTIEEEINANDNPIVGKEAFRDGNIYICTNCYHKGYFNWVEESMSEPIEDFSGSEE